jgi:Tfp pilus assembly protein PilO
VVILVGCLLACLGAVAKVREVDSERAAVEKQLQESQTIAQTQKDSENKYLDTRAQIKYLESSVSTQAYVPTLLKQLEHTGESVNLKVMGVRPKTVADVVVKKPATDSSTPSTDATAAAPPPTKPYDEVEIDLTLEGDYMNALDFLYRLTSFPKILAVNTVQMDPVGGPGALIGSPRLTITMNVTAFVFKETKESTTKATGTAIVPGRTGHEAG